MAGISSGMRAELESSLAAACDRVGLVSDGAELIRFGVNAVFRLRSAPVVVRIRRSTSPKRAWKRIRRAMKVTRALCERGAPLVPPAPGSDRPVLLDGGVATFWQLAYPRPKRASRPAALATSLRALHEMKPVRGMREWALPAGRAATVEKLGTLSDSDRSWLIEQWQEAEADYHSVGPDLVHGVIHGDANLSNVLWDYAGDPLLCDLDNLATGPVLWDLVPGAVAAIRYGHVRRYNKLSKRYGIDVTQSHAWPVLRRIRELNTTTALLNNLDGRPVLAERAAHRMRTLRAGDDRARWGAPTA